MAANTSPIYSRLGDLQFTGVALATANTATDGTGTVSVVFTADATNGGRLERLKIRHLGTNIATVLRVFVNNGATNTVATNNSLFTEITVALNSLSQVAASIDYEISMLLVLPPGYRILCTVGTTIAAGVAVVAAAGKY